MKPLMVAAPSEATDDQLVSAAREGSDEAFEALFRRYGDRITGYVRGIVRDHARAEDIVQDVFMSALRSLRSTDREVLFKPWVYEIAKNACIDHLRKARRASEVSIDSEDFSPVDEGRLSAKLTTTDAAYSAREELDALKMAFNDLPTAQREVLVSRELEGLSYDTISSRTGLSRSAVESMLFRARRSLKNGFDDIATGDRCQRMQTVMARFTEGGLGLRQERRLVRHLRDCAGCRREAIALGLDDLALGAPTREQSALSRLASLLPLPAFLRRRWLDGAGLAGPAGQSGVEQGASLATKAAVVLAAAAIAGGGAGLVHETGVIGSGGGPKAGGSPGDPASPRTGDSPQRVAGANGRGGRDGAARPGSERTGGGGRPTASKPGGAGGAGDPGGRLGAATGKGGSAAGDLDRTLGGLTNGAGGTAGGTVDGTVKGVGETVDGTVKGVGGTVDGTVKGVGETADGTVKGVGGTVDGVTGLAAPTQPAPSAPALPKLKHVLPSAQAVTGVEVPTLAP